MRPRARPRPAAQLDDVRAVGRQVRAPHSRSAAHRTGAASERRRPADQRPDLIRRPVHRAGGSRGSGPRAPLPARDRHTPRRRRARRVERDHAAPGDGGDCQQRVRADHGESADRSRTAIAANRVNRAATAERQWPRLDARQPAGRRVIRESRAEQAIDQLTPDARPHAPPAARHPSSRSAPATVSGAGGRSRRAHRHRSAALRRESARPFVAWPRRCRP